MDLKVNNQNLSRNKTLSYSRVHSLLNKMGNITPQSIQNVSLDAQNFLLSHTPKRMAELAKLNCYAAAKVKSELDKNFGEGKYEVIAIGRSVSSITELLGHMGVNVKIIPLSGLRKGLPDNFPENDIHAYKAFLGEKGLTKYNLKKNPDKTYILMDYSYYGRTLKNAEKLLRRDDFLGDVKNLTVKSINEILGEDFKRKQFDTLFQYNRFKNYSYVGSLNISNLADVFNQCSPDVAYEMQGNTTKGMRNLFWFNVYHFFNNGDYKNVKASNEIEAIYKHYLSMEAIRRYIRREQEMVACIRK